MNIASVKLSATSPAFNKAELIAQLAGGAWTHSTIKSDRRASVHRGELAGQAVVVKFKALDSPILKLKHAVRLSQFFRHWRGAALLNQHGIPTATPLALGSALVDGVHAELLILEYVPGQTLLEILRDTRDGSVKCHIQTSIALAVGQQLDKLCRAGIHNRDHKPSNIIIRHCADWAIAPELFIIDCVGVCSRRAHIDRMLASLYLEPLGCGCPPRRALCMRAIRRSQCSSHAESPAAIRKLWHQVAKRIIDHGDPTPRVNPLESAPGQLGEGPRSLSV